MSTGKPNRIVLFGGTFDPIHCGHLIVARAFCEQCGFEKITFIPASSPPHKEGAHASGEHRLAMLKLAVKSEERAEIFDICEIELARTGCSYTFDTLEELRRINGADTELVWVVGADMLEELPCWHRVEEVVELARIVIAVRPPWDEQIDEIFGTLRGKFSDAQVDRLMESVIQTPLINISSTQIRRRVRAGESIKNLTPYCVIDYIKKHDLYISESTTAE